MENVVKGAYYCQQNRTTQLSNRMYKRNVPGVPLQMNYDPRPVDTKFVVNFPYWTVVSQQEYLVNEDLSIIQDICLQVVVNPCHLTVFNQKLILNQN